MEFKRETAIAVLDGLQSDGLNNLEITEVLKEALLIHCVSQQRELLKRFIDYINYLQATAEDIPYTDIDVFLKRFNCG